MYYENCPNCDRPIYRCTCKKIDDVGKDFFKSEKPKNHEPVIDTTMCQERLPNGGLCWMSGSFAHTPLAKTWYCAFHWKLRNGQTPEFAIKDLKHDERFTKETLKRLSQIYKCEQKQDES